MSASEKLEAVVLLESFQKRTPQNTAWNNDDRFQMVLHLQNAGSVVHTMSRFFRQIDLIHTVGQKI